MHTSANLGAKASHRTRGRLALATTVTMSLAALMASPTAARAAAASDLYMTVDAAPLDSVSVSRTGLVAYAAYKVHLENRGGNTINQVVFVGTTSVSPSPNVNIAGYAYFVNLPANGPDPGCTSAPTSGSSTITSVKCNVGQLQSHEFRDFFLLFETPHAGASLNFKAVVDFSEGNSSDTKPANFFTRELDKLLGLTTVETQDVNSAVKTVLPPKGGKFFTGQDGAVNSSNVFSTSVQLQTSTVVTDNNVLETVDGATSTCSAIAGYFCFGLHSKINIDNAANGQKVYFNEATPPSEVTITLRQDAASLRAKSPVPSIGSVKIFYTPDQAGPTGSEVPPCSATVVPIPDHPCVAARNSYLKGSKGYYEYVIRAVDNGRFDM